MAWNQRRLRSLMSHLRAPISLILFNRPAETSRVFEAIAAARPSMLLIIADGPRAHVPTDVEECRKVREIVQRVDWRCDVRTNYADINLGCRRRVATGLDWVFDQVNESIIVEDDCLPDPTFFPFCDELLERYREDTRIMMISGDAFRSKPISSSYYFTRYPHVWGWATWRRTWNLYDQSIADWPRFREDGRLLDIFSDLEVGEFWTTVFDAVYAGEIDTWDYQLVFAVLKESGLCIMPAVNLVSNIGFGPGATHTYQMNGIVVPERNAIAFPLKHPRFMIRDVAAEVEVENRNFRRRKATVLQGLKARLKTIAGAVKRRTIMAQGRYP